MEEIKARVRAMEDILNEQRACQEKLKENLEKLRALNEDFLHLKNYYGSDDMEEDLRADEEGALEDIARGVLTQDSVYELIGDRYCLALEMLACAELIFKEY
ncbi:MAG: DUF4298 domain-containing protein [Peptoniphilus sp.]|nr:DUF4298 domain-containing protein [Peptoniphilus sp.]MDD7363249.1 DUF4298 domain-containing protein [Bacillota bacterium]MDY6045342.1 DUF4298 domain-containing protein [Peptoniphilus sp.]